MNEGKAKNPTVVSSDVQGKTEEEDWIAEAAWPAEELVIVGVACGMGIASNVETHLEDKPPKSIVYHLLI